MADKRYMPMVNRLSLREHGIQSFRDGRTQDDCPFDGRTIEGREWLKGWRDAARRETETSASSAACQCEETSRSSTD